MEQQRFNNAPSLMVKLICFNMLLCMPLYLKNTFLNTMSPFNRFWWSNSCKFLEMVVVVVPSCLALPTFFTPPIASTAPTAPTAFTASTASTASTAFTSISSLTVGSIFGFHPFSNPDTIDTIDTIDMSRDDWYDWYDRYMSREKSKY